MRGLCVALSGTSMDTLAVKRVIDSAIADAEKNDFKGYDPYDALNTSWGWLKRGKWPPILLIQTLKRLPINIRPLLGIRKEHNPKGVGLFLEACAYMERVYSNDYRNQTDRLVELLDKLQTPGYTGACWGYNFEWASPVKVLPSYSPTVVVTGFIAKALFSVIENGANPTANRLFRDIEHFIAEDLPRYSDATGLCISYSTVKKDCCFNASLLAAGYYARLYTLTADEMHARMAREMVNFVVHRQKPDGSWAYSIDLETGAERMQTDFHQGYILDSILEVMHYLSERPSHWEKAVRRGGIFYFDRQFAPNGRTYFRIPKHYPADVHHQAQGIITAQKMKDAGFGFGDHGDRILQWGLNHLYNGQGKFYYRVFPAFTDKTCYLRWGQGWMTLAAAQWYERNMRSGDE